MFTKAKNKIIDKYKSSIREKSIEKAKIRLATEGVLYKNLSPDDFEVIVAEEEDKLIRGLKDKSLYAIIVILGIGYV